MNMDIVNKLMSMLPDGKKKQELVQKYQKLQAKSQKRGGDGLQDTFEFQPKGHIKIEAIDENRKVVGLLADQPNLVVDGAEEILLRSFSGDPNRMLYKNRKVKDVSGATGKIYISESKLAGLALFDANNQLLHAPNLLWAEVEDSLFEVSYGFYPTTVYVKEEVSTEVGKKAFSIANVSGTGRVPMSSEIYSTYTNLFIGIGEGKNVPVELTDSRISMTEGFIADADRAEAVAEGEALSFSEKISNFKLEVEASNEGAQIDVFINGVLKETIETFDSELVAPEIRVFEYDGLDYDTATEVRLVHSGKDAAITGDATMAIVGLHFDALHKGMNALMKEFKNFEVDFTTPTSFNTTPMAPFTVQLPHFPLKADSVKITYEGIEFTEVESKSDLTATSFHVDEMHGVVTFNRALTGIMATFSSTGELFDTEMVSTMTATTVPVTTVTQNTVTDAIPSGAVNGTNVNFTVTHSNVDPLSLVVKVAGVTVAPTGFNPTTRVITLATAPQTGETVTATYVHSTTTVTNKPANIYKTSLTPVTGSVKVFDQDGNALALVTDQNEFGDGKFILNHATDLKEVKISKNKADGQPITRIEMVFRSEERPGVPTNYTRAVIEKPKTVNEYPWFQLDKGAVQFVAEFPELKPSHNITIREMGLFDGPRVDDKIAGFRNYPVKAFSLVRVGEARKDVNTGIRITWTITLLNSEGQPFQGGLN